MVNLQFKDHFISPDFLEIKKRHSTYKMNSSFIGIGATWSFLKSTLLPICIKEFEEGFVHRNNGKFKLSEIYQY